MTVWTTNLPTRLPDSEPITTAAENIRNTSIAVRGHVGDAQQVLFGLDSEFDTPHTASAKAAFGEVVQPFVVDLDLGIAPVSTGLETFASDIDHLRTRFTRVKEDVAEHNDRARPPADDPLRAHYDEQEQALQREVDTVAGLYDDAVEKCENKVREGSPFTVPEHPHANGITFGVGVALTTAEQWFQNNRKHVRVRNGRITIVTQQPIRRSTYRVSGAVMSRLGIPDSYVSRYTDVLRTGDGVSIGAWERAVRGVDPRSALGVAFARSPWLKRRFLDAHPQIGASPVRGRDGSIRGHRGNVNGRLTAQDPRGTSPRAWGENRNRTIRHPSSGRWGTAAKWLGGVGFGVGFASAASSGYNASVERNPHADWQTHAANAAVDASIETGASVVGAQIGGAVGRAAGAAVGQALIPIPGVGAAVGAVAGGLLGNVVGGYLGGQVGKGINAARHSDDESFGGRVTSFVGGLFS